jgi:hypothetical protein
VEDILDPNLIRDFHLLPQGWPARSSPSGQSPWLASSCGQGVECHVYYHSLVPRRCRFTNHWL